MRIDENKGMDMRKEWYLVRFQSGKFVDRSPYALSRGEADNLLSLAGMTDKGFTYKVMHQNDIKKLSK